MVIINNKTFPAEYLQNPDDLQRGMMGRDKLEGCMVFKMGMGTHSFWMKKCLIPLDIVFVNKGRISNIHRDCQPCDMDCNQRYSGIGDHVIEFPSGVSNGWKIGDKVKMYLGAPQNPVQ